jgi:hypothetical protein
MLAPLLDYGIDFKDFVNNIKTLLRPWLQTMVISTPPPPKKKKKKKGTTSNTNFQNEGKDSH